MAFTAIKILMCIGEKLRRNDDIQPPITAAKRCRICQGEDGEGEEEWVAPCRCPSPTVWVHRHCLALRFEHTPIEEDKIRCVDCGWAPPPTFHFPIVSCSFSAHRSRYAYEKCFRLKSLREWFDGWKADWPNWVLLVIGEALSRLSAHYIHRQADALNMWDDSMWLYKRTMCCSFTVSFARGLAEGLFRVYVDFPEAGLFNIELYKRVLSVAVYDWVLDAPSPSRSSASATL
jgi:hypothetical protein